MALTLDESTKLCDAAMAKANELGIKISVAVCDPGGRLISFARMDGAIWASVYGSQARQPRLSDSAGPASCSKSAPTTRPSGASSPPPVAT